MPSLDELLQLQDRDSWLLSLSQISAALSPSPLNRQTCNTFLASLFEPHQLKAIARNRQEFGEVPFADRFSCLYALQYAAAFASSDGPRPSPSDALTLAMRLVYRAFELINDAIPTQGEFSGYIAGIAERSSLGHPHQLMCRSYGLWLWKHARLKRSTSARDYFDRILVQSTSLSLESFLRALYFVGWVWQIEALSQATVPRIVSALPRTDVTEELSTSLDIVVQMLSTSVATFHSECSSLLAQRDRVPSMSLLAIKKWPMVQLEHLPRHYMTLSSIHVVDAAFQRPIRLAEEAARQNENDARARIQEIRGYFGDVFEDYIHGILASHTLWKYVCLRDIDIDDAGLVDGVAYTRDMLLFVECKGGLTVEATRYSARNDHDFGNELVNKHYLAKAQRQIDTTLSHIKSVCDRIGCTPKTVASLIVCADVLPISVLASDAFEGILKPTYRFGDYEILQPLVMSVGDVEDLVGYMPLDWHKELQAKQRNPEHAHESLLRWLKVRKVRYRVPAVSSAANRAIVELATSGIKHRTSKSR